MSLTTAQEAYWHYSRNEARVAEAARAFLDPSDQNVEEKYMLVPFYMPEIPSPNPIRMRLDFRDTVEVLIGSELPSRFIVPRAALCLRSGVLNAACSERWRGAHPSITLEDVDATTFSLYLETLYQGNFPWMGKADETADIEGFVPSGFQRYHDYYDPKNGIDEEKLDIDIYLERIVRNHILAHRLLDLVTANIVIDTILRGRDIFDEWRPRPDFVTEFYDSTGPEDPMRTLLLIRNIQKSWDADDLEHYDGASYEFIGNILLLCGCASEGERDYTGKGLQSALGLALFASAW